MNKEEYKIIAIRLDKSITLLMEGYDRINRKWTIDPSLVAEVQSQIRDLRHQKTMAWESMLVEDSETPKVLLEKLGPIVARRQFTKVAEKVVDSNSDGDRFTFPLSVDLDGAANYVPKHLRGFWSCPGCMALPEAAAELVGDYSIYRKQIDWCPRFIRALALPRGNDPVTEVLYRMRLATINKDADEICFAGLLHSEFQTTETEAKLVRYCDTCNYSTVDTKQLAEKISDDYTVDADQIKQITDDKTIFCKCTICGITIFEDYKSKVAPDGNITAAFDKQIDDHYISQHPDVIKKEL